MTFEAVSVGRLAKVIIVEAGVCLLVDLVLGSREPLALMHHVHLNNRKSSGEERVSWSVSPSFVRPIKTQKGTWI